MSTPPPPNQPYRPQPPQAPFPPQFQPSPPPVPAKKRGSWITSKPAIGIAALLLGLVLGTASAGGSAKPAATVTVAGPAGATITQQVTTTATAPAVTADAVDPTGLSNNGWKITTFNMKADGAGSFGATARIVNATGADKKVATFTVTVLDASKNIVATLVGLANSVAKDATVTVQLVSTDPYKAGTYLYAFQVNASL